MASKNEYGASSITVLEGLEAVRKRPGMYIGDTGPTGLHHLVWEVVDNSVDEAMAGYADTVTVTLRADGGVEVIDNGRGIPVEMHPQQKKPTVEVVMTILHAGGKFDSESYAVSGGLHGVGISVVNALSHRLDVEIHRGGSSYQQTYTRSKPGPLHNTGRSSKTGTTIVFWPDDTIFETIEFSFDTITRRLQQMAFLNKGLTIILRDEREGHAEDGADAAVERTFHYPGGLVDYVRHLNATKEPVHPSIIGFESKAETMEVEVAMQWNASYNESVHSFANTINTLNGGTHEEGVPRLTHDGGQQVRHGEEAAEGEGRQALRRGRPGGVGGHHLDPAARAAVRGPDEGQAGQHRGEVVRAEGLQRVVDRLVRTQPHRGQDDHLQGDLLVAGTATRARRGCSSADGREPAI